MNTQRLTLVTAVIVALAIIAVIVVSRLQAPATAAPSGSGEAINYAGQPTLGDENAPVQLAVFEDFKCPFCSQFEESVMPQLEREYIETGQAKLTFFNFHFLGPDSRTAALASECAFAQNPAAFWDYKTVVYRAQGPESQQWATSARLEELARAAGVNATPTLFVNGEQVPSALDYASIKAAIDEALAQADPNPDQD